MTELQIGQSLTYEQVMALPDGAVVTFEDSAGQKCNWYAWNSASREQLCVILEYSVRTSATLVSLPSIEPKANDNLISEKLAQSSETAIDTSPAPVAEIEKEAALALLAGKLQELQALGARDYVCRVVDNYRAAVAYAKSKGAL